jgi:hypothetical protein
LSHFLAERLWGFVAIGAAVILAALFFRAVDVGEEAAEAEAAETSRLREVDR